MLVFEQVALHRGTKVLFSDVTFNVHPGQRLGITGANGTGKSSLLALIRGELQPEAGDFRMPQDWVIAHVAQETPADARPALEYVLDGDAELRELERRLAEAEAADQGETVAELHARIDTAGGYTARSRAARLMHGVGFRPGDEERPVQSFSGGWRMRLNLAQALMCRSDLLLLDEPTNHLDLDAVIWLEQWLKSYRGTLMLISHDRDFLDAVTTHIVHIEQQRATLYTGNYSDFERLRAEKLAGQQAQYRKQQREIAHIRSFVDRFRAKATKARQAQSRLKALERMELIAPAHVDSPFHFQFRAPEKLPNPLLTLEETSFAYGDVPILKEIALGLSPGDRVGLLGHNGAGKSTLIKLLAGELEPRTGKRKTAQDLNIGYFAQHQLEQLDPEQSPLEHLQRLDSRALQQTLRDYLGGFGFPGEMADSSVAPFSGGEKARLVLAMLVYRRPNLLLLDEPTNHLDLEMRQALGTALQEFEGAMVVVSHDRHLLRLTTDQLLLVNDGKVTEFEGDLDDYPRWLAENRADEGGAGPSAEQGENSAAARKERKRLEAERRRQLQPLRKKLEQLESELERFTTRQSELEQVLADPGIYAEENRERLKGLLGEKAEVDRRVNEVEEAWMTVGEELEAAQNG